MKRWLPLVVAVLGAVVCGGIAYAVAGNDIGTAGDFKHGAQRFIGFAGAIGLFAGYFVTARLVRGPALTRDGFTVSYPKIVPQAAGYRELATLTVADLRAGLAAVGYAPELMGCDELGTPRAAIDPTTALAGCNVAVKDRGVTGWVRVELPVPREDRPRGLGLVEIWAAGSGGSAEELALFVLRVLDGLVGDVQAARDSSRTTPDPVALVTAGLGERPMQRRS